MPYYSFAGIQFEYLPDDLPEIHLLKPFRNNAARSPDIRITFNACNILGKPAGKQILSGIIAGSTNMVLTNRNEDGLSFHLENESKSEVLSRLDTDRVWNRVTISYLADSPYFHRFAVKLLGNLTLKNKIVFYNGLVTHASAIMYNGKGIIFSAPSGTGKSTHTKLWEDYLGAKVINDDSPALRIIDGKVHLYGTPWSGSTIKFDNSQVPLSAIVMLVQAKENKIAVLDSREAINRLLPQCYIPFYNRKMCEMAMETFETVVNSVPVYLLQCRPEKEAMELVYQCII